MQQTSNGAERNDNNRNDDNNRSKNGHLYTTMLGTMLAIRSCAFPWAFARETKAGKNGDSATPEHQNARRHGLGSLHFLVLHTSLLAKLRLLQRGHIQSPGLNSTVMQ